MTPKRLNTIIISDSPMEAYNYLYTKLVDQLTTDYGIEAEEICQLFQYCSAQSFTSVQTMIRHNFKKRIFDRVKEHDGEVKCVTCGSINDLTLHHIKSQHLYPEERYNPTNIAVLCDTCHKKIHNLISKEYDEEKEEFAENDD